MGLRPNIQASSDSVAAFLYHPSAAPVAGRGCPACPCVLTHPAGTLLTLCGVEYKVTVVGVTDDGRRLPASNSLLFTTPAPG
jgi:hypothetical protein